MHQTKQKEDRLLARMEKKKKKTQGGGGIRKFTLDFLDTKYFGPAGARGQELGKKTGKKRFCKFSTLRSVPRR